MSTPIGTCGFAESHAATFRDFGIVEIQQTFYQPPRDTTAEKWRAEAPQDFVFTLKAWQLITHEAASPTYRLHGRPAYHYRYRYTDAELQILRDMLRPTQPNRVLFNNDSMADDARRFIRLLTD